MEIAWHEVCIKGGRSFGVLGVLVSTSHRDFTTCCTSSCTYLNNNNWRMGTHLFLPGQQNAVVDGNLDLDGDLVEIRGSVSACRKRLRGWAVLSRMYRRTHGGARTIWWFEQENFFWGRHSSQPQQTTSNTNSASSLYHVSTTMVG